MPFEYTPYRSPFTGAIADLIGRQGDIAAQQALNEAKARTQAVSGVAQSLGNLAQYRADAPKRRLEQAMLAEKQQQLADAQESRMAGRSLSAMMFDPNKGRFQPEGPSLDTPDGVLPEQEGFTTTTADGVELFDKAKVGQRMAELGHGAWMLEHGGKIDELNKSLLETDARDKQTIRDAVVMWAGLPKELQQPGASHIFKLISKRLSPEQAAVVQQQIDAGDTNGLMQMAQPYLPKQAPRIGQFDPTKDVVDLNTGQVLRQGAPATEATAQYNARVNAARAKIQAGTATPDEQALVEGVDADIAARRPPQSVPLDKEHADLLTKKAGGTLTRTETIRLQAIEQTRKFIPQFNVNNRVEPARSDVSSYNQIASRIEALAKPVIDRRANLQKIVDTLNTPSAVADSLVAPELLTAMAGGAGSGIRINEAEIKRVLGARSTMQSISAALMKVQSGQTVTPEVRRQMSELVKLVKGKVDRKVNIVDEARQALAKADSIENQRQIFADMAQKLDDVDTDGSDTVKPGQLPSLNIRIGQMPGATAPVVGAR